MAISSVIFLRPHDQRPLEDAGEAQRVVHLVGEVAAAGGHDVGAGFLGRVGIDLRHRVGAGENDGLGRHLLDPGRLDRVGAGLAQGDQHVGAGHGLFDIVDAVGVGLLAELPFAVKGRVGLDVVAAQVQGAGGVEHDHLGRVAAGLDDQPGDGGVARRRRRRRRCAPCPDSLPTTRRALIRPARVTEPVPWASSCHTGILQASRSVSSTL